MGNRIESKNQLIIGIGASDGGAEALHLFFEHVPPSTGCSFVVIQSPLSEYHSLLADMLSHQLALRVVVVEENVELEPDTVYVIHSRKEVLLKGNQLQWVQQEGDALQMPIDVFFDSLAQERAETAVGILLSGTGVDGTKGIAQIKKAGGVVLVQDPSSAKFDEMLNSAIHSGNTDYILSPELMWEELVTFSKQRPLNGLIADTLSPHDEQILLDILTQIKNKTACDFTLYKRPTITRRLARRMAILNQKTLTSYYEYLKDNPNELELLCKEFLIGVTQFFRDPQAYELLREKLLHEIVLKKGEDETIKVWSAGCSTGEEAYSLAILFKELLTETNRHNDVKIFASDLDKEAIEFASKGMYPCDVEKTVSPMRLLQYFVKEGEHYRVHSDIRRMVIFSHHDVIKDPPFSKTDLISCRNMLIYLNPLLQRRCLSIFHFSLNVGGILFLGPSENMGELGQSFAELSKKWKIYQNLERAKGFKMDGLSSISQKLHISSSIKAKHASDHSFAEAFSQSVAEEFRCTGIYVDSHFNIIDTFGNYKKYLRFPEEKFNANILRMLPEEIAVILGTNLRKAARDNEKIRLQNIRMEVEGELLSLNIVIQPTSGSHLHKSALLLLLTEVEDRKPAVSEMTKFDHHNLSLSHFLALEHELRETKEFLQRAIEESETSAEEMQSSNEELVSSNEELQSTNEELQSLNEELQIVNNELQTRIKEISELNDDLNNYFRSTDIGKIFLDKQLVIRKFTPSVTSLVNLIESDIGRSITHFATHFHNEDLLEDLRSVLATGQALKKEVRNNDGRWFEMKTIPYLRKENTIDGVIVAFSDITDLKNLNTQLEQKVQERTKKLNELNERYQLVSKATNDAIWDWNLVTNEVHWSNAFKTMFGYKDEEIEPNSDSWYTRIHPDEREKVVESIHHVIDRGGQNWAGSYRFRKADGTYVIIFDRGYCLHDEEGKPYRMVGSMQDISEKTRSEEALQESRNRFQAAVQAMDGVLWTNNSEGKMEGEQPGWEALTGQRYEEYQGYGWAKAVHPDDAEASVAVWEEAVREKRTYVFEHRLRLKDGRWGIFVAKAVPLFNAKSEIKEWVGVHTDVTKEREYEQKLKESEAYFKMMANNVPVAIWVTAPDGFCTYLNKQWYDFTGQSEEQATGYGWLQRVHPDDAQLAGEIFLKANEEQRPFHLYYRLRDKDGQYFWHLDSGLPRFDESGNFMGFVGSVVNVHEKFIAEEALAKSEDRLRLAVAATEIGTWDFNPGTGELIWDTRCKELFGLPADAHIDYAVFLQGLHADDREKADQAVQAALDPNGSGEYDIQYRTVGIVDQKERWIKATGKAVFGADGTSQRFIGTVQDITEQKSYVEALKIKNEQLQKTNADLDNFVYAASHDLKSPISNIEGLIIALSEIYKDDPNAAPLLQMIEQSIARFKTTIQDLTEVAKLQSNFESEKEKVRLRELSDDVQLQIAELIKNSGAVIKEDYSAAEEILFSKKNLRSIFYNIISNAIKYRSPYRTPLLEITSEDKNDYLILSFKDNGLGIKDEDKHKVFAMFKRLHTHVEGTGVGMAIVKRIIDNQGGSIEIESEVGKGSVFKIYLKK